MPCRPVFLTPVVTDIRYPYVSYQGLGLYVPSEGPPSLPVPEGDRILDGIGTIEVLIPLLDPDGSILDEDLTPWTSRLISTDVLRICPSSLLSLCLPPFSFLTGEVTGCL